MAELTPVSGSNEQEYEQFLKELVDNIKHAQTRAALAVNRELVSLYWNIGRTIIAKRWADKTYHLKKWWNRRKWRKQKRVSIILKC